MEMFILVGLVAAAVQLSIVHERRGRALTAPLAPNASPTSDSSRPVDETLRCHHCGAGEFDRREGQLNTSAMTFLDLDWANTSAAVLTCRSCGFMHWFLPRLTPSDHAVTDG